MSNVVSPEAILEAIQKHLTDRDAVVMVTTMTRSTAYRAKHADMFRLHDGGLQVQQGRRWNVIAEPGVGSLVSIRFGYYR